MGPSIALHLLPEQVDVLYKMAHPALPVSALLGEPVVSDVVGIVLAILLLVVRIL